MTAPSALAELRNLAAAASASGRPALLGLVGPPGVGKSYTAARLAGTLPRLGISAAVLPMDGFHLANRQLDRAGLRSRKGAPETFDVGGFIALLARLAAGIGEPVYCPDYDRELHEPIAGRLRIEAGTQVVVVEGNYLLLDGPWRPVRELLAASWYLESPATLRHERLVERHRRGRSEAAARDWIRTVDEPNAALIAATRSRAHRIVDSLELDAELGSPAPEGRTREPDRP